MSASSRVLLRVTLAIGPSLRLDKEEKGKSVGFRRVGPRNAPFGGFPRGWLHDIAKKMSS